MSRDREFEPLRRGARTGSAGWILLGGFVALVAVATVARLAHQDWWVTPAVVALVAGVVAPIAFVVAWREGVGRTLVVRPDSVEMVTVGRRGTRRTVVRRDVAGYRAAFAPVQRGPQTSGSDRILLLTDGQESIWVVDTSWGLDTQREIAEALRVPFRDEWTTRADLKASVTMPSPLWERRPVLLGVLVALSIPVVLVVVVTIGVLLMSPRREFEPLRQDATTRGRVVPVVGLFVVLVVAAVVAHEADQEWWVAPALFAVVVGVVAPIALVVAWRGGMGRTLVVTPDTVEMVTAGPRGTVRTVVRRDIDSYRVAFAPVQRSRTPASDPVLVATDGQESIWVVEGTWGADVQRAVADELVVELRETWTTRARLKASVGIRSPFPERRPIVFGVLLALSVVVVVFAVAAFAGLID